MLFVERHLPASSPPSCLPSFPTVDEICSIVDQAAREEAVLQRMHAPFSYLPEHERHVLTPAVRAATRRVRTWIFDEPEVEAAKKRLGVFRGKGGSQAQGEPVRLADFRNEYTRLLAESCVLQHRVAETLSARNPLTGRIAYVDSVRDALQRHDRDTLLRRALELFEQTSAHEQRRFAFGSSLKTLVERALTRYPSESHQLLLTSTRGDFWSRYDQDLLAYVDQPSPRARRRLMAMYFDHDPMRLKSEVQRLRSLSAEAVADRRRSHLEQGARLARARIQKGYAKLGDMRMVRPGRVADAKGNIEHIDELLWVDNVLEKFIDHKHLLHHEVFLRLHLVRLAVAAVLRARGISPVEATEGAIRDAVRLLLGASQGAEPNELVNWPGHAGDSFSIPDTQLALRVRAVLQAGQQRRERGVEPRWAEAHAA